jgi:hypothetical protein
VLEELEVHSIELVRRFARYLPMPNLDTYDSNLEFPRVTALVLERFDDHVTFEHFRTRPHEIPPVWAKKPSNFERRARNSRCFANHDVRRVREWAAIEAQRAVDVAALLRERATEDLAARIDPDAFE